GLSDGVEPHELLCRIGKEAGNFFLFSVACYANNKLSKGTVADWGSEKQTNFGAAFPTNCDPMM
ncbi:MAG: hypothetical protein F6K42_17335, partial [Leptolyngbya sp. SIO1D8]|nr:hypothetical protein [Leptolyngbya sp. SIO1D8]